MTLLDDLSFLIREPEPVYRKRAKDHLTSHSLADFRKDPFLYHKKEQGLVVDEDRPAFALGRAAHTLILEGRDRYEAEYAFGGPVNPKTGEPFGRYTKAFERWAAAQGKPVLTDDQAALIEHLHASVRSHAIASELLSNGVAEGVVRTAYLDIPCQGRLDWLNPPSAASSTSRPATTSRGLRARPGASATSINSPSTGPSCSRPRADSSPPTSSRSRSGSRSAPASGSSARTCWRLPRKRTNRPWSA